MNPCVSCLVGKTKSTLGGDAYQDPERLFLCMNLGYCWVKVVWICDSKFGFGLCYLNVHCDFCENKKLEKKNRDLLC